MKTRSVLCACALLLAVPAWAQPAAPAALGSVSQVNGLVTMSFGSQVGTVQPGTPIFDGARLVSSSTGSVTMNLQGGCSVTLQPNQMVAISSALSCQQQIQAIVALPGTSGTAVAGLGGGGTLTSTVLPLLGAGALAAAVAKSGVFESEITPRP